MLHNRWFPVIQVFLATTLTLLVSRTQAYQSTNTFGIVAILLIVAMTVTVGYVPTSLSEQQKPFKKPLRGED